MVLAIFPTSPLPGGMVKTQDWNETDTRYDSGAAQGLTPFLRPLMRYSFPYRNINEIKNESLQLFVKQQRNGVTPFLMKDPDPLDFRINSVFVTSGDVTEPASLNIFTETTSFFVHVDTTTIGSLTSNKSGFVTLGSEYDYDQDTGLLTVKSIDTDDFWTAASLQYFKKCKFAGKFTQTSPIWNQFSTTLIIEEIV